MTTQRMSRWMMGLALLGSVSLTAPASAVELPELTRHLTEMLETTEAAVNSCGPETSPGISAAITEESDRWYYRRFSLRFRPRVSFGIPGFAKLEIVPELEMLWQRDLPADWVVYKP